MEKKEITLQFTNYKLFEKKTFELSDYNVFLVEGPNSAGKTTLITALQEMFLVSALTTDPVTTGAHEGSKTFQIPDKDGNIVTVQHTYDRSKAKGKFVAFDKDGNPLRKVGEIRELLGTYTRLTTEQFFDMAKTAEGRRRIISDYFVQFLTPEELGSLKKLQDLEGVNYDMRTDAKKKLDSAEERMLDYKLTPADEELLTHKVAAHKRLNQLKTSRDDVKLFDHNIKLLEERDRNLQEQIETIEEGLADDIMGIQEDLDTWQAELKDLERQMVFLKGKIKGAEEFLKNPGAETKDKVDGLKKLLKENRDEMEQKRKEATAPDMTLEVLDASIAKGEKMLSDIAICESRKESYEKAEKEYLETKENWEALDKKVEQARGNIKALYASSALPSGVQIEDDTFTLNGYEFSETQISESKAKLVIAEIMCQVDTSPLLVMGNAGSFGQDRLNELCGLAEKHNKIMFLEKVVDDTEDVRVVGIVHNKVTKEDKLF